MGMLLQRLKSTISWVILIGNAITWSKFLWTRGTLYVRTYASEYRDGIARDNFIAKCKHDPDYFSESTFRELCDKTMTLHANKRAPWVEAGNALYAVTHSCIDWPCSELLYNIAQSWTTFFATLLLTGIVCWVTVDRVFSWSDRRRREKELQQQLAAASSPQISMIDADAGVHHHYQRTLLDDSQESITHRPNNNNRFLGWNNPRYNQKSKVL
jgi:hypothetical protein